MIISKKKQKITSAEDIAKIMTALLQAEGEGSSLQERFWAIGLNQRMVIQYIDLVSLGTVQSAIAHPREIFRRAIVAACSTIIVCHNHPTGELELSDTDIELTQRLIVVGEIIGITLSDHIIFCTDGRFISMNKTEFFKAPPAVSLHWN